MSPIEGLSDKRWYPRLGKVRLGLKKVGQKGSYPAPVDYFICPDEVQKVYGEKPQELDIMFPSEKLELIAPQYYKCYSYSKGKICQGTGKTCHRKIDTRTGSLVTKDSREFTWADGSCDPEHCEMIGDKQCRPVMSLIFLLPQVPGLGVYQLDTSSVYSMRNVNSQIADDPDRPGFIRLFTRGRIQGIPLKLSLVPQEVNPPDAVRKTVYVLNIRSDILLADIIKLSTKSMVQVLLPTLDDDEAPDDLFPNEVLQEGEGKKVVADEIIETQVLKPPPAEPPLPAVDPDWAKLVKESEAARNAKLAPAGEWDKYTEKDLPTYPDLEPVWFQLTGRQPREMYKELGVSSRADMAIKPWDAFLNLKSMFGTKKES